MRSMLKWVLVGAFAAIGAVAHAQGAGGAAQQVQVSGAVANSAGGDYDPFGWGIWDPFDPCCG